MIMQSDDDDVAGPYILLQRNDTQKWKAESFNLLEDALKGVKNDEWTILKPVKLKIIEDAE